MKLQLNIFFFWTLMIVFSYYTFVFIYIFFIRVVISGFSLVFTELVKVVNQILFYVTKISWIYFFDSLFNLIPLFTIVDITEC